MIFCGDYIDRGHQSTAVLEFLIPLARRKDLDVRTLKGNHEEALLNFITAQKDPRPGWILVAAKS